jgi:osmoprotectant transport system substrate-binding protein
MGARWRCHVATGRPRRLARCDARQGERLPIGLSASLAGVGECDTATLRSARKTSRRLLIGLAIAMLALAATSLPASARRSSDTLEDRAITVGAFDFAESELLGEIYSQALEAGGVRVERAFGLGPREVVLPALQGGLVELVPEYAGTALRFASLGADDGAADVASTQEQLRRLMADHHVSVLTPAPAQDANVFVVRRATAARHALVSLSDLASVSGRLTFGGPPECPTRPFCLAGLERVYGVAFDEVVSLDAGGPLTKQALRTRVVDVALLFSTDPDTASPDLVELVDDRRLQPAENITPLIRTETLERFGPSVGTDIDAVSALLTTEALRALNAEVAGGASVRAVAARWLRSEGLR